MYILNIQIRIIIYINLYIKRGNSSAIAPDSQLHRGIFNHI